MIQHDVGILLAGGLSRRYGTPKAFATWKGKYFYEWTYDILTQLCKEVIIVTRPELQRHFPENMHTVTDVAPFIGRGPLAGIYSGMEEISASRYVVLPCDMPLMESGVMKQLIAFHQKEVTVVKLEGQLQPLVSIWSSTMKDDILQSLQDGKYHMRSVLNENNMVVVQGELLTDKAYVFTNINTREEERGIKQWIK